MLARLGWTADRAAELTDPTLVPARVTVQERGAFIASTGAAELTVQLSGRMRHAARGGADLPAVGDWVLLRDGVVDRILPRRTRISRKVAWQKTEEQVLAANVNVVLVVSGLDGALNARRLERYLAVARESGAQPVVVLSKADRSADVTADLGRVRVIAAGAPVHAVSSLTGDGVAGVAAYLTGHRTAVLLGPSGVGKSTLTNALLGDERQDTGSVREGDGRGRHTTTRRQLFVMDDGVIIDTPGLRELQLWDADLDGGFSEIVALEAQCRFPDCGHESEPGCAIRAGILSGSIDESRLDSFRKLGRELAAAVRRQDKRAAAEERRKWRVLNRQQRQPRSP